MTYSTLSSSWSNQAFAQLCAFRSPVLGSISVIGIINSYTAFAMRPTMKCSVMHTLNPLLILCTCIVAAQGGPHAPALSQDKPEVKAEHISIATEDGGLIYADLYGKSD